MGDVGFFEKTDSRKDEGILGGSEGADKKENEEETAVFSMQQQQPTSNFDLNLHPVEEDFINSLFNFDSEFPEMQTENPTQSESIVFGVDLNRKEENPDPDVEIVGSSSSKKRRLSAKEIDELVWKNKKFDLKLGLGELLKRGGGEAGKKNYIMGGSSKDMNSDDTIDHGVEDAYMSKMEDFYISRKKEESRRHREIAKTYAKRLAHEVVDLEGDFLNSSTKKVKDKDLKKIVLVDDDDDKAEVLKSPFGMALEMIRIRNSRPIARKAEEFKWVPKSDKGSSFVAPKVPSLLDLSIHTLAKNAEAMVSLDHVPDMLRHKLSQFVCDCRKMDAHFVELLARGSPTEIRVKDGSLVTEDEFTKIFGSCDTKNLIVLQLDLCGSCIPDYVLQDTLARSPKSLPALVTLSLNGAYRLTDKGLNALAKSAPALQSINLSQCSLLTSAGINNLASFFKSTLRELYLDECHNVEAMVVLPALRKLECLEVLSLAGIQTVCDDFIIGMLEACGKNIKELVLTNCVELTDVSLRIVGKNCSSLCAIDLSYLRKLTDSSMRYLANGCRSINRLKLCRNSFSDEAIAAFLEASGGSLTELSLNNVTSVGLNTALSLAKCSRKLFSLDLSWCRNLTDEALGLIVDSCLSLRLLKLFGCRQITDVFLSGHSNAQVEIIGVKMTMVSKHLNNMHEHHEAPLRYSTINRFG
ncbi:Leucine-rich repeat, cysteine-containing subtype [Corchorus capsularis]|uniref:Leucine-rich repeat, cysteine-containing subtype n=1 Tax=Corchorus capsularis TaxID=210143 RepID=A0A1R3H9U0_COCAP|nr:Leucine-rich repeat, cysteine-containing subtype [Corchorus capsularis]